MTAISPRRQATKRAVDSNGNFIQGFDEFLKEASEQASKAKGAALSLKLLTKNWDELTANGWTLNKFEGTIPDIETGHKLDIQLTKNIDGEDFTKSIEAKNWKAARSIEGDVFKQFKAYIASGHEFEYYFSDGLQEAMKSRFQAMFKNPEKAKEIFDTNENLVVKLFGGTYTSAAEITAAAKNNALIEHINWVK